MFVKLFTPVPPVHLHVVFHAIVFPLRLTMFAHCWPDVAPDAPHWSRKSSYWPAVTVSHWPQCEDVSIWRFASSAGAAAARRGAESVKRARALENIAVGVNGTCTVGSGRTVRLGSLLRDVQEDGASRRIRRRRYIPEIHGVSKASHSTQRL